MRRSSKTNIGHGLYKFCTESFHLALFFHLTIWSILHCLAVSPTMCQSVIQITISVTFMYGRPLDSNPNLQRSVESLCLGVSTNIEPFKFSKPDIVRVGRYTDPQGKDTWCMTNCDLYGLMERVVYPPKNTPSSFYLKKFSFDPTTMRATEFFNQAIQCLLRVTDPFILPDNSPAEEGHYLLLQCE